VDEARKSALDLGIPKLVDQFVATANLKDKKVLEDKNRVIGQLQKNKQGPVLLLDELAKNTPQRVWIVSLNEQGGMLDIDGKALTNIDIVEYVNNLRSSKYFTDLHLIESRQGSEGGLEIYQFKLKSRLIP